MPPRVKVYFDGGCRPNPGAMEIAVVIGGREHIRRGIGAGSSMDAEWLALIEALSLAHSQGIADFVLLGDAAAVIRQASGGAKCPASASGHKQRFDALVAQTGRPRIRYIKRAQNLAGIALARDHPR
jgi:ribonuclease HI